MAKNKETQLQRILYPVCHALWYTFSLLPMWWHYLVADFLYLVVYHLVHYRVKLVRKNLKDSFPEKTEEELLRIEKGFYHHFTDLIVETFKMKSISAKEMRKRMTFVNIEPVIDSVKRGKNCGMYLGHYGNWEWISSMQLWIDPKLGRCCQLYHPLENRLMDRLINQSRERFGNTNIPVEQSLRHMVRYRKEGIPVMVGFIADQVPFWNNIHYWTPFLNHPKTPVFSGPERLCKQFDMDCYYFNVTRPRRGYWQVEYVPMVKNAKDTADFELTEQYTRLLEKNIQEHPEYWLWSHNRWKRTYEEWQRIIDPETGKMTIN